MAESSGHSGGDFDSMNVTSATAPTEATQDPDLEAEHWMIQSRKKSADDVQLMDVKTANAACRRSAKALKGMDILFIGSKDVGKTAVVDWLRTKTFVQRPKPNKGTRGIVPGLIGAKIRDDYYLVSLIDTSGEEEFRAVAPSFYRTGHGAMVVYDLTNLDSLKDVARWHLEVMNHCKGHEDTPCILIGNKTDLLSNEHNKHKIVNGINIARDLGMSCYFQTSAKNNGDGIEEAMKTMISLIDTDLSHVRTNTRDCDGLLRANDPSTSSQPTGRCFNCGNS